MQAPLPRRSIGWTEGGSILTQPIDPKQEQRVWSRVMAAQTAQTSESAAPTACERLNRRDIPVFDECAAQELYTAQLRAAATYRSFARTARGCVRRTLLQLAEEKCCAARRLAAVHFLMTGRKPCAERVKPPCVQCLAEALRQAYREELCAAELYRRYASRSEEHAALLEQLACAAGKNAKLLLCALQSCL